MSPDIITESPQVAILERPLQVDETLQKFPELAQYLKQAPWIVEVDQVLAEKYPWKFNHSVRLALLAIKVGEFINLPQDLMYPFVEAALTHDSGFGELPETLVNYEGRYNDAQREQMQEHALTSIRLVKKHSKSAAFLIEGVHQHNTRTPEKMYPPYSDLELMRKEPTKDHPIVLDVYGVRKVLSILDHIDANAASDRKHYKPPYSQYMIQRIIHELKDVYHEALFNTEQGQGMVAFALNTWNKINDRFNQMMQAP